jgi:putative nucleotidyltransferase with HDIG domain
VTRDEALQLVKEHVKTKNLIKHMLAAEAILGRLAQEFDQDEDAWRLAGLVHDVDYEHTQHNPEEHAVKGAEILRESGCPEEVVHAVLAHAEKAPRESLLDKALYATDPLTGLIVAAALVHPDRKLASIDAQFVLNRYGEKSFARGANRETIAACQDLGLDLAQFIALGLEAMQGISKELGL